MLTKQTLILLIKKITNPVSYVQLYIIKFKNNNNLKKLKLK